MIGFSLSQYRIEAELGRGGMGIVYKATDTKLNRTVAIKVLPPAALTIEGDRARFFREAQSAAALSHPNVCHVYGVDEAVPVEEGKEPQPGTDSRLFIAMEFIEGQTLQDYIRNGGPMKLTEAVAVAAQVAEALKAAHAKDIVHRDIKSANVMITADGVAKVLDFGLAKTNQSTQLTRMGSTMGTVAYMSPEQARGQEVDGRTDLYSLGTMMYEMIAGKLPFDGEYEQAVVYSILNESPEPLTALRTGVPMQLEWIVNKLLSKDADYRYQSAAGLLADLKSVDLSGGGATRRSMMSMTGTMPAAGEPVADGAWWMNRMWWGVAAGVLLVGVVLGWILRPEPSGNYSAPKRMIIKAPGLDMVSNPVGSPDGRMWAFSATDSVGSRFAWIWDLAENRISKVNQSENARSTFFSPDGNWLSMTTGSFTDRRIHRVRVPFGSPILVDSSGIGMWLSNEEMVVQPERRSLARLSVESGEKTPIPVSFPDSSVGSITLTDVHPDGGFALVYNGSSGGEQSIWAVDLSSGDAKRLVQGGCCAKLYGGETLIYHTEANLARRSAKLVAQRFNADRMAIFGPPVDLHPEVAVGNMPGFSGDDTFVLSTRTSVFFRQTEFSWLDTGSGRLDALPFPSSAYARFSISPDGTQFVAEVYPDAGARAGGDVDLYVFDIERRTQRQFVFNAETSRSPSWSSDGMIYYSVGTERGTDRNQIYRKRSDGVGPEELVVEDGDFPSVSSDGKWLVFVRLANGQDIWAKNIETGEEIPIDTTAAATTDPIISPNGKFVVMSYVPEGGVVLGAEQRTVVRSFPDPTVFYQQVTQETSDDAFWSKDGDALYYRDRLQGNLFRIGVSTDDVFAITSPVEHVARFPTGENRFNVDPVSGRIMVAAGMGATASDGDSAGGSLDVIFNFSVYLDELFGDK